MKSTKITMTLCVRWKKSVKLTIVLDPENVECAKDISNNIDDESIKVKCHLTAWWYVFRKQQYWRANGICLSIWKRKWKNLKCLRAIFHWMKLVTGCYCNIASRRSCKGPRANMKPVALWRLKQLTRTWVSISNTNNW